MCCLPLLQLLASFRAGEAPIDDPEARPSFLSSTSVARLARHLYAAYQRQLVDPMAEEGGQQEEAPPAPAGVGSHNHTHTHTHTQSLTRARPLSRTRALTHTRTLAQADISTHVLGNLRTRIVSAGTGFSLPSLISPSIELQCRNPFQRPQAHVVNVRYDVCRRVCLFD